MPPLERSMLHSKAVVWSGVTVDRDGDPKLDPQPREIDARVVWGQRQMLTPQGGLAPVDAQLETDEELAVGEVVWDGRLADFDPDGDFTLMEVATYSSTPDVKGRESKLRYGLVYFRASLPDSDLT
jgi:hypothetical protein